MAEIGALKLFDDDNANTPMSLEDLYQKVAGRKHSCGWECYEVYRHLKSLGYIVGRHGIPWTEKGGNKNNELVSLQGNSERNEMGESLHEDYVAELFNNMHINAVKLAFDIYLPNSKFKKSSPVDPSFVLCVTR